MIIPIHSHNTVSVTGPVFNRGVHPGPGTSVCHFSSKFQHKMALVTCPCAFGLRRLICVLSSVLSYVCFHMCALICVLCFVLSHVCSALCSHMCALICVLSYMCMLSYVCFHMCALICVLAYVCSHMCAPICVL